MNEIKPPEEFWDLDDDDLDLDQPPSAAESSPEPVPEAAPAPVEQDSPQPVAEQAPATETPVEAPVKVKAKRQLPKLSLIEKISVLAVIVTLGGAAAWGISTYFRHAPQGEVVKFDTDFPVKGNSVTVSEIESWWRSPIREGEDADRGVRIAINLIPCARIKIEDTQNALLWVTFRNGNNDLVGDPINLVISGGKFDGTGSDEIEIHSTSGFSNASEINAYTNEDIKPWSIVMVEGSEGEEFSSESEPFLNARIEANIPQEKEVD